MNVCKYWNSDCENCPFGKLDCIRNCDYTKEDWIVELKELIENCQFVIDNLLAE